MLSNQILPILTPPHYLTLSNRCTTLLRRFIRRIRSVIGLRHGWRFFVNMKNEVRLIIQLIAIVSRYRDLINEVCATELPFVLQKKVASAESIGRT